MLDVLALPRRHSVSLLSILSLLVLLAGSSGCIVIPVGDLLKPSPLEEQVLREGDDDGKVAILEIRGAIAGEASGGLLSRQDDTVREFESRLKQVREDDDVVAVVLLIDSPGGEVTACDLIHHRLTQFREEKGLPVVAAIRGTGASGGYYIASAANEIHAGPTAVVGSIGVILQVLNVSGLLDKIGVEMSTVQTGEFKNLASPFVAPDPEHLAVLQAVIDPLYERFLEVVDTGRDRLDREQVKALADGRVFAAPVALENGLVDHVGHLDETIERAAELAGVERPTVVTYGRGAGLSGTLGLTGGDRPASAFEVTMRLDPAATGQLRCLYLWRP